MSNSNLTSSERKLDFSDYRNPPIEEGFNEDMLTQEEKLDLGFKQTAKRHNNASSSKPKCSECGKHVKDPVTSYEKFGYDFIEEGEILHEGCARRRYEALVKFLNTED